MCRQTEKETVGVSSQFEYKGIQGKNIGKRQLTVIVPINAPYLVKPYAILHRPEF